MRELPNSRWPPGRAKVESPTEERRRPNSTVLPLSKNTTTATLGFAAAAAVVPFSILFLFLYSNAPGLTVGLDSL